MGDLPARRPGPGSERECPSGRSSGLRLVAALLAFPRVSAVACEQPLAEYSSGPAPESHRLPSSSPATVAAEPVRRGTTYRPPPRMQCRGVGVACFRTGRRSCWRDTTGGNAVTEQEWLKCNDPEPMLAFVKPKASLRKLRLFAVACCNRINPLLVHPVSRKAVEIAELNADELVSDAERDSVYREADDIRCLLGEVGTGHLDQEFEEEFAALVRGAGISANAAANAAEEAWGSAEPNPSDSNIGISAVAAVTCLGGESVKADEQQAQAALLRCSFGNHFRPVAVDPAWLTSDVRALATGIYQDRAFDRMPILADALQDAGCDNDDILNHCRSDGPHVRGCWVVDLLLGKE